MFRGSRRHVNAATNWGPHALRDCERSARLCTSRTAGTGRTPTVTREDVLPRLTGGQAGRRTFAPTWVRKFERPDQPATERLADRKIWEQIWGQNSAKLSKSTATGRARRDSGPSLNCSFETIRTGEDLWCPAHNLEVARSNPVPATTRNGLRRFLRGPFLCPMGTLSAPVGADLGAVVAAH
jgi:hypothetical protein